MVTILQLLRTANPPIVDEADTLKFLMPDKISDSLYGSNGVIRA